VGACDASVLARARRQASLQLCSGCSRVAYCDAACQKADWKRHKRVCTAADAAEAALADATCVRCHRPLMPDAHAELLPPDGLVTMLWCGQYAHRSCCAGDGE
jgi:hypothetical protein